MNNLRGINKGAFKCWQILYRHARHNVNTLERRQMASNAFRSTPRTPLPIAMTVPMSGLYTTMANVWTGLQGQRTFATKVKSMRFDKFGRKMQNVRQREGDKVDGKKRTRARASRDEARHSTARSWRIPVPMGPEGRHLNAALEYGKAKMARKLYMKNKSLLQRNNNESCRRKSVKKTKVLKKTHKSVTQPSQLGKMKSRKEQESHAEKPERDNLKHLLADLLDKRPKAMKSFNFEYVKTSPIFKLLSHSAEHRHELRGRGFQKQLEIPTFVKHPLVDSSHKRLNFPRRPTLFPTESQFEKRTKEALKQKLCLLLLQDSNKDPDDDLD